MAAPPLPAAPPYATPAPAAFEIAAPESSLLWCTSTGPSRASGPRLWTRCAARAWSRRARRRCTRPRPRAAPPRARTKAADQRREKAEADAEALRAQLADAEARHRAARDAWALKEKKLRAAAAPRDEPPATILDGLVDAVARRPDAEAEELEAWASRARQFQRAVEERIRDTGATPRPPTAAEPPTPAKTAGRPRCRTRAPRARPSRATEWRSCSSSTRARRRSVDAGAAVSRRRVNDFSCTFPPSPESHPGHRVGRRRRGAESRGMSRARRARSQYHGRFPHKRRPRGTASRPSRACPRGSRRRRPSSTPRRAPAPRHSCGRSSSTCSTARRRSPP